jgi:hypothetical protein
MPRTKGSKNIATLIKEAKTDIERNELIEANKHLKSVQKLIGNMQVAVPVESTEKKKRGRPKKNVEATPVVSVVSVPATKEVPVSTPGLEIDFGVKRVLRDTKPNPNHSYYQYIHPCNLHLKNYHYKFYIVKDGKNIESKAYENIKDCHAAVRELIEGV